jgi:hypothetical protein
MGPTVGVFFLGCTWLLVGHPISIKRSKNMRQIKSGIRVQVPSKLISGRDMVILY